jgi:hypothetical protein
MNDSQIRQCPNLHCKCNDCNDTVASGNLQTFQWKPVSQPPEKDGRYLILRTFSHPCILNDSIVRKNIPFVGNYRKEKGWTKLIDEGVITHWMEIPPLKE